MAIDRIEAQAGGNHPGQFGPRREVERARIGRHAKARQGEEARMMHGDAVADFLAESPGIAAAPPGEPGHRRQHRAFHHPAAQQLAQPVLDEDPVIGLGRIRVERAEGQQAQRSGSLGHGGLSLPRTTWGAARYSRWVGKIRRPGTAGPPGSGRRRP